MVIPVEIFSIRPKIHHKDRSFQRKRTVFFGHNGFFDGIGTTDRAAITLGVGKIAGPHTLNESDPLRNIPVRRPKELAFIRPRGGKDPLKFQRSNYIRIPPIAIFRTQSGIIHFIARGKNHRPDLKPFCGFFFRIFNSSGQAYLLTKTAADTLLSIDGEGQRNGLRIPNVDSRSFR